MTILSRVFCTLMIVSVACSCGRRAGVANRPEETGGEPAKAAYAFSVPSIPSAVDASARGEYLASHYWDNFDFDDETVPQRADSLSMVRLFAEFTGLCMERPTDADPFSKLFERASASREMYRMFSALADNVLHDPNSPLRNDEFYAAVLESRTGSPYCTDEARDAAEAMLALARLNRPGHRANDFTYVSSKGAAGSLHALKSEFILVFFNNPGCAMCERITGLLKSSEYISSMVGKGLLTVLAVYPDSDLDLWRQHSGEFPESWINAYNPNDEILGGESYDLSAIPSLYLLDRDKTVLVKDCTDVRIIESTMINKQGI